MSWRMRCQCDACGAWKGEGNKWLLASALALPGASTGPTFLGFARWDDATAQRSGVKHLCGDACKQKMLGEHLAPPKAGVPESQPRESLTYVPIERESWTTQWQQGAEQEARVEVAGHFSERGAI